MTRPVRALLTLTLLVGVLVLPATPAGAYGTLAVPSPSGSPAFAPSWAKTAVDADAPDPDVVRFGSSYVAYTTGTSWGNHIGILVSSSPQTGWHTFTNKSYGSSAFPSLAWNQTVRPWQVNGTQHAPGVFRWGGRYVMYYAAQTVSGHGGHWCLSVATASQPTGPFTDSTGAPWLCMDAQGGAIDPSPFVDASGKAWLYFKTYDDIERSSQPARIYAVPLTANGLAYTAGPSLVLSQSSLSSPYETVENPQMFLSGGQYFLLYSRGQWSNSTYRQGYATCTGPLGPCSEGSPTAILSSYPNVNGPGGGTVFTDGGGGSWLAYQGWSGTSGCAGYSGTSCARKLFVTSLQVRGTNLRVPCSAPSSPAGYRLADADGSIFSFGNLPYCGSAASAGFARVVGLASTSSGGGYWIATAAGDVLAFGDAHSYGSMTGKPLAYPVVGMARTPSGHGYWLVASDGGIFSFGDARFYGSTGNIRLAKPIVGISSTPTGAGYWMVASDGGIFAYGDARFYGSTGNIQLAKPIVGMSTSLDGKGYRLVASDGGIFAYGDDRFYGSTGNIQLAQPIVGMAPTPTGAGYWMVAADGGIFSFGDARFYGSTGGQHLAQPIVRMAV